MAVFHQNIGGFNIPVDDSLQVEVGTRGKQLFGVLEGHLGIQCELAFETAFKITK